jgi:hypothetical protein
MTVEMAVRLLSLAPAIERGYGDNAADGDLPFKRKPLSRSRGRNATNEFDYDYRHNSLGFRDVEHALVKKEGTVRILGLGDSFTYGVGVPFEETYLYRLEALLNDRAGTHSKVEIIKAGIPRYFPEPERMLLERYGSQFRPDLILVGFLPNDVVDTHLGLNAVTVDKSGYLKTREAQALGRAGTVAYLHCHFCRVLLRKYVSWRIESKYQPQGSQIYQEGGFHERDWIKVEQEYDKMAAIAASIGAGLFVFHIPQRGPWTEKHRYPAARLAAWAKTRNVGFADLLPAMEHASASKRLYYEQDGHCTPAGHALIAQELHRRLIEQKIIR